MKRRKFDLRRSFFARAVRLTRPVVHEKVYYDIDTVLLVNGPTARFMHSQGACNYVRRFSRSIQVGS